jgi:hypothetical protein
VRRRTGVAEPLQRRVICIPQTLSPRPILAHGVSFYDLILTQFPPSGIGIVRRLDGEIVLKPSAERKEWKTRTLKCKSSLLQVRLQFILEAISSNSIKYL